jgi:hypothetical protein
MMHGCCRESKEGEATVFTYAPWVPASMICVGIVSAVTGVAIRRKLVSEQATEEALPDLAKGWASARIPSLHYARDRTGYFKSALYAWFLIAIGPIVILCAPSYYLAAVRVSPDRFSVESGWVFPKLHDIAFKDLSRIELVDEEWGSRRRNVRTYLNCHLIDGSKESVLIEELEGLAVETILEAARKNGLPVVDRRENN